jgi:hypothetical protein
MELNLKDLNHSVLLPLKKLMAEDVMCDSDWRKMWEGQSRVKKLIYSLSNYQAQFTGIISLQFRFFARKV